MKINVKRKFQEAVNGNVEGFSIIELIMVIVIAGIAMAIALPRLTAVTEVDLYSTARQVKSDIRYTQELAMSKYRQTTITFGSNTNTYTITSSGPTQTKQLPPSSKAIFSAGSTLIFTFNAFGEPIIGGGGTLIISSGGSNEQIMVSSITGTANIL
jgi:prepilin-type N-terminal cleavage/methylation domain-containing protein